MDHAASLPYVLAKTNFAGRVYMTHPTKAIYKWLMQDSVRVQNTHAAASGANDGGGVDQLFNEHDILSTLPQIQTISFNTTHTHNGIRITPYPAGHVLGACMYLIEIAGLNTLFTGDYSRENDRHLIPATIPKGLKVDCLITESTFGISTHIPRAERETALMKSITGILNRGGRALLPVFAIGMAQELLLILEEYWQKHPDYRRYPIYFASALARKCMVVYQTYIDSMNDNIRSKLHNRLGGDSNGETGGGGPWDFQFIRSLKSLDRFDDVGGCVMLASPGMLQNGVSRTLLERWAPEGKNGVVITGYSVEGTMAKEIMKEPDSIPAVMTQRGGGGGPMMGKKASGPGGEDRPMIPRRCTVQEFSFAAHVDGAENRAFIEEVNAPVVVLVHGERGNMMRMRSRLLGLGKFKVYSPANCEEVRIPFRREKVAKVVGRLANEINPQALAGLLSPPASSEDSDDTEGDSKDTKRRRDENQIVSGVLVQNEFKLSLMAPEDLREYAGLNTTTITCRQRITLGAAGIDLIKWSLEGTFGSVDVSTNTSKDSKANGNGTNNSTTSSTSTTPKPELVDAEMSNTDDTAAPEQTILSIMNSAVRISHHHNAQNGQSELELEWEGNATNDAIADAVMAVLLSVESSPAAIKRSAQSHSHEEHKEPETMDVSRAHPLAAHSLSPAERLSRLFMFLEAQFGENAITPIAEPKLPPKAPRLAEDNTTSQDNAAEDEEEDPIALEKAQAIELARLHALGIPVPGLLITVDKSVAKVWLEGLEVECANRSLGERVRAVCERGVEVLGDVVF
jgi:cleavage and polyadenylation specificity factor subunit 3